MVPLYKLYSWAEENNANFLIKTPGKHLFLSHNNKGPSKQYEYISELPSLTKDTCWAKDTFWAKTPYCLLNNFSLQLETLWSRVMLSPYSIIWPSFFLLTQSFSWLYLRMNLFYISNAKFTYSSKPVIQPSMHIFTFSKATPESEIYFASIWRWSWWAAPLLSALSGPGHGTPWWKLMKTTLPRNATSGIHIFNFQCVL